MSKRFSVIANAVALVGFSITTGLSLAIPAEAAQTVTCESQNRQRNTCYADTSNSVRISRQLSDNSCNGNWGYDRNRIWVKNGCRAEFLVGSRSDNTYGRDNTYNRNDRYGRNNSSNRNDRYGRDNSSNRNNRYGRSNNSNRNDRYDRR
jgi:hypothetical protein